MSLCFNSFALKYLMFIKTVFIHDADISNHLVSNHYCAALSTVVAFGVGVGVAAGVSVALTGIAKYF